MKKSVVILIGIIYIVAIYCVNFFGLQLPSFHTNIPITSITCVNQEAKERVEDGQKFKMIKFKYKENGTILENSINIVYEIEPKDLGIPSNKLVKFVYDKNDQDATVEGTRVIFHKRGGIRITLQPKDTSAVKEVVEILAY